MIWVVSFLWTVLSTDSTYIGTLTIIHMYWEIMDGFPEPFSGKRRFWITRTASNLNQTLLVNGDLPRENTGHKAQAVQKLIKELGDHQDLSEKLHLELALLPNQPAPTSLSLDKQTKIFKKRVDCHQ